MPRPTGQDFPVVENSLSPAISAQKFRLPHHFPPLFYPARHFVDTFSKRVSRFITMPSPRLRLFGLLLSLVGSVHSQAQVSITASGTYTQDFDTLITTASATWTDNSTLTNWSAQRTGTGNTIAAGTGSSITGALYSFGTGTASDRALGTLGSATPGGFAYGVIFQNNSGATVTLGTLSYMGEQWRNSAAAAQDVTVWYKIGSSPITNFSAGSDVGWNQLAALTFTSPITGGTAGALDGNASANRASLSASLGSITLTSGQYLAIRFSDIDHPGSDHGLAIDNFALSYSATAIPEPATCAAIPGGLALAAALLDRRRQQQRAA
jgi:hypothetical protein